MARTKKKTDKFVFKGFINLSFSVSQREMLKVWQDGPDRDPGDCLQTLLESGYKVGFSYDDYHGTNQVALTCRDPGSSYFGYCFTFKHNDPMRSLVIVRWFYDAFLKDEAYIVEDNTDELDW